MKLYDRVVISLTIGVTGIHRCFWGDPVFAIAWFVFFICGVMTLPNGSVGGYALVTSFGMSLIETLYWARKADPHPNWVYALNIYKRYTIGNVALGLHRGGLETEELRWKSVNPVDADVISIHNQKFPRLFVYNDDLYEYAGQAPMKLNRPALMDYATEGIWLKVI